MFMRKGSDAFVPSVSNRTWVLVMIVDCTDGERRAVKRTSDFLRIFLVHAIWFSACIFWDNPVTNFRRFRDMQPQPQH